MITLNELTDIGAFSRDVAAGYIRGGMHPDHPRYMMLCYTPKTQFSGHWVKGTTLLARGLAVRLRPDAVPDDIRGDADGVAAMLDGAEVVGRGMRKFFTVDASNSEWGRIKLVDDDENVTVDEDFTVDFDAPATVADKLDGELGVGVIVDGRLVLGTKGSFTSEQAREGTGYLNALHDGRMFGAWMERNAPGCTPIFEIIRPDAHHIVDYHGRADVVFLGLMVIATGRWVPAARLGVDAATAGAGAGNIPVLFGFDVPEVYHADTLAEALSLPQLENHEGMVATLDTDPQQMFKIKYPEFLKLQHLRNMMASDGGMRTLVRDMTPDAIMHADADSLFDLSPEVRTDPWARRIIDRESGRVMEGYILPIRSLTDRALKAADELSARHDMTRNSEAAAYVAEARATYPADVAGIAISLGRLSGDARAAKAVESARTIVIRSIRKGNARKRVRR